ncbi:MAG: hypothetical protein IAE87_02600 [Rhodobacteraceae bacterium]|jgi:hypothetical protein|nr:hypothetical protein [Paracoccaceae bacterium]
MLDPISRFILLAAAVCLWLALLLWATLWFRAVWQDKDRWAAHAISARRRAELTQRAFPRMLDLGRNTRTGRWAHRIAMMAVALGIAGGAMAVVALILR